MHILIAYDEPREGARADELDVLAQAQAVEEGLQGLGHTTSRLGVDLDLAAARKSLIRSAPELVFNLVESLGGAGRFIHFFPALLDELGLPYTGSPSTALHESSSKLLTRRRLLSAGLPVAAGWSREELGGVPRGFRPGRYIIKSVWEHASLGLDEHSIVHAQNPRELQGEIDARAGRLGRTAFAEAFIDGREFNLAVLGGPALPEVLPPAEIRFEGFQAERPRIVGYNAKWDEASFEYQNTQRCFDYPEADQKLLSELRILAQQAFKLFGLRGYARVDFRVDTAGRPWILEVNANPCLSPDAGFAAALNQAGIGFSEALRRILADTADTTLMQAWDHPKPRPSALPASLKIREDVRPSDREAVRSIVASSGFFHDYEIAVAVELVEAHLQQGSASGYHFLYLDGVEKPLAYACFGPIACTEGSFDLYWIAVDESQRNLGLGRQLLALSEERMRAMGARAVWVETSARALYEPTRAFYRANGYEQAAVFPEFYAPGDGKVVFVKWLGMAK